MFHDHAERGKALSFQWLNSRRDVLMPQSLQGVGHLALKGDQKMISVLSEGLDNATSIVFILMLIMGTFLFTMVALVQVEPLP